MKELFEAYLRDASRRGPAPEGSVSGASGGAACGDYVRISLLAERGRIGRATFEAEGCGTTVAAAAAATEAVEGHGVLAAARVGSADLAAALGGLTPGKLHAADVAADALHRALCALAGSGARLAEPAADRVLVALSGGVDSSVAALLEREAGYEVACVTVKLWADVEGDGERSCCSPQAVVTARRAAHALGLPHLTLDLEQEFRAKVVDGFLSGHAAGRTPNPCVLCNGTVRIDAMLGLADRLGAVGLATGHYARTLDDGQGPLLVAPADAAKDQTYMLSALDPRSLERLRFPLAALRKDEVRAVAARAGLASARRPESQDLCFLAGVGKRRFLERHGGLGDRAGQILDEAGRVLGEHAGHHGFTVGQRRGIGVAAAEPLYVLRTDAGSNTVTVGSHDQLATHRVRIRDAVLHRNSDRVNHARLRYHSTPVPCHIGPAEGDELVLNLDEPFYGATPGQTACLMDGEAVVGYGTIAA